MVAETGTSLGGDWVCNRAACISHLVLQPCSGFVAYMVPQPAEEDKDFLLLPATGCIALVCAERGKSAQCLSRC